MSLTTNQTSASDKQPDDVHQLSLAIDLSNTQNWKDEKQDFQRRRAEEKVQEEEAAEKTGVPMEDSKVPTKTNKCTVEDGVTGVAAAETSGVPMDSSKVPT